MTADQWTRAVRHQLGLGRLLPLGGPQDGAWLTESAADSFLRRAARDVPGVRLGALRLGLADPEQTQVAAVPPPPSALPPGPLRISGEFEATLASADPLPSLAAVLRAALAAAATERLGLTVTEVDLRVTGLLEEDETDVRPNGLQHPEEPEPGPGTEPEPDDDESRVAAAALAVPGVTRLTGALGGLARPVHITEYSADAALPRRHVRVEIAVRADRRTVDVAREVRAAASEALPDHPTVAVLVTEVSAPSGARGTARPATTAPQP
ncbi:nucleopolyhedrovirus P10 family protein [Streptomyces sporangiiformans]|uniref:Nucleopolyhedrovirus P10 family protein n=1 Tax=Streptomyces sporangiiformans TaxID=2315329 RepID=A0A505DG75_9ACTN|nr:nucleopolyhedrovirus P10 family protein [Streptomyces sporangiiformans]TPQ19578.1 nucleopolyhedrovirus P10 family protein [Streptomyces sporangiiformans]